MMPFAKGFAALGTVKMTVVHLKNRKINKNLEKFAKF